MATAIAARADTARRKSSEVRPPSVTNAETSQEDMRMRVFSMATVVMERPRAGGEAINCNQIFSVQVSRSSGCPATVVPEVFPRGSEAEGGGEVCFGAIPGVVARDFKPLAPAGGPGAGRGFPVCVPSFAGFWIEGPAWQAGGWAFFCSGPIFTRACPTAFSHYARMAGNFAKASPTEFSVYSF